MKTNRIRWFRASLDERMLVKLGKAMLNDQYEPTRSAGFRMDVVLKHTLTGTFIERIEYIEVVKDPCGLEIEIPRVDFRLVRFRLSIIPPELELLNPPKTCRGFTMKLAKYSDFDISINDIIVNPSDWLAQIESKIGHVEVFSIDYDTVAIAKSISASISISGGIDVRNYSFPGTNFDYSKPRRVAFRINSDMNEQRCSLLDNGAALIRSSNSEIIIETVHQALGHLLTGARSDVNASLER